MKTSEKGIEFIKSFEGFRSIAYRCPANILTIGYGHTKNVKQGQNVTELQATEMLKEDLLNAERYLNKYNIWLNQNQFDALVSFIFNCGIGNFSKSTLLKKVIANPNNKDIANEFIRWNKSGGKVLNGLTNRRKAESQLYFS